MQLVGCLRNSRRQPTRDGSRKSQVWLEMRQEQIEHWVVGVGTVQVPIELSHWECALGVTLLGENREHDGNHRNVPSLEPLLPLLGGPVVLVGAVLEDRVPVYEYGSIGVLYHEGHVRVGQLAWQIAYDHVRWIGGELCHTPLHRSNPDMVLALALLPTLLAQQRTVGVGVHIYLVQPDVHSPVLQTQVQRGGKDALASAPQTTHDDSSRHPPS